jgi:Fe2+ transport system protein FeoA
MCKNPGWHAWQRVGLSRLAANDTIRPRKFHQGVDFMTLFGYEFSFGGTSSRCNGKSPDDQSACFSLAQVKPGRLVRVKGFLPGISNPRAWHLQSYGVVPGCWLQVIQQSPVTIVQVDHLELALEGGLAAFIQVEES